MGNRKSSQNQFKSFSNLIRVLQYPITRFSCESLPQNDSLPFDITKFVFYIQFIFQFQFNYLLICKRISQLNSARKHLILSGLTKVINHHGNKASNNNTILNQYLMGKSEILTIFLKVSLATILLIAYFRHPHRIDSNPSYKFDIVMGKSSICILKFDFEWNFYGIIAGVSRKFCLLNIIQSVTVMVTIFGKTSGKVN